jgi:hypothetical protein
MKCLINYSDDNFKNEQKFNSKTGAKHGFERVLQYKKSELDTKFLESNSELFKIKKGGGLWIWKSQIILDALKKTSEGDYLFYSDSGLYFIENINPLVDFFEKEKLQILFFNSPLLEIQWTSKLVFNKLDLDKSLYGFTNQIIGGYFLFKNNSFSLTFFKEFHELCNNHALLVPNEMQNEDENFIEGRHDQSILSLLAKKYGINSYRDISQFGDNKLLIEYFRISNRYQKNLFLNIRNEKTIHSKPILILYRRGKLYNPFKRFIFNLLYIVRKFNSKYIWRLK